MERRLRMYMMALLAVACGAPAPIRIGIVLNSDGERAAMLAAADVNAAGGIHGRPLELRVMRGLSSTFSRDALMAAESLATDQSVLGVVGHTNSAASLAASQVYEEHHLVQIAPTTTAPLYSDAGPYNYRMVASDVHQGAFLAAIVLADSSRPRAALMYVNDDYGRALRGTFVQNLAAQGAEPVYEASYEEATRFPDVGTVARLVARSRPALLVWLGRSAQLRELMPPLRTLLPDIRVLASDGFDGNGVPFDPTGMFIGVRYVRFRDLENPMPASRRLSERFHQQWKGEFTDQFPLTYDAVRLLAEAIGAGGADRESVRKYVASIGNGRPPFQGVAGPITFDARGDPPPSYFLGKSVV